MLQCEGRTNHQRHLGRGKNLLDLTNIQQHHQGCWAELWHWVLRIIAVKFIYTSKRWASVARVNGTADMCRMTEKCTKEVCDTDISYRDEVMQLFWQWLAGHSGQAETVSVSASSSSLTCIKQSSYMSGKSQKLTCTHSESLCILGQWKWWHHPRLVMHTIQDVVVRSRLDVVVRSTTTRNLYCGIPGPGPKYSNYYKNK